MTCSKQLFLFFFFLFPLLHASSHPKECSSSSCGRKDDVHVRFPFWLLSKQPEFCGHAGFDLNGTTTQETVLNLPMSGTTFLVREIDYTSQHIRLYDPDNCLARKLLTFDDTLPLRFLATASLDLAKSMLPSCEIVKTLDIPVSRPFVVNKKPRFSSDVNVEDLWLKWDSPSCGKCERDHLRCGFISNVSLQVKCLPFGNFAIGVFISKRLIARRERARITVDVLAALATLTWRNVVVVTTTGLDESTIESYKKMELGESRRLPGVNDIVSYLFIGVCEQRDRTVHTGL
ncbi:unnamed protein product [Cochlearia groenlandica]